MKNTSILLALVLLVLQLPNSGMAKNSTDIMVSVVGLDGQGQPRCQGMGVCLGKTGVILTSAYLLSQGKGGIIQTSAGDLHLIQRLVHYDALQDLALVQVEAEDLPAGRLGASGRWPSGKVLVGERQGKRFVLREVLVAKTYQFSPRLVLLRLEPPDLALESGAPVFNLQGELVGMIHSFAGAPGNSKGLRFCLVRNQTHLSSKMLDGQENNGEPETPWENLNSPFSFWEGVAASQRQDWKTAKEKFTTALQSLGDFPEGYLGRGVALYHLGNYKGAVKDLTEATRRLPAYAQAFLWLGKVWERDGDPKSAKEAYQQAVSYAPDLGEAWFRLGVIAYQEGDQLQAQKCLERGEDDFSGAAQRWWYLGMIARAQQSWPKALEAFNRAAKLDPGFFSAYLEGGKLLIQDMGQPKDAVGLLREAVRLEPNHAYARYYLALAQLLSWNPGGAWEQYFALQERYPDLASGLAAMLERRP